MQLNQHKACHQIKLRLGVNALRRFSLSAEVTAEDPVALVPEDAHCHWWYYIGCYVLLLRVSTTRQFYYSTAK
jgi:hypothetical protein